MRRLGSVIIAMVALSLACAAPASALPFEIPEEGAYLLVAVGEGKATHCLVRTTFIDEYPKDYNRYWASTECNVPIQQSAQAFLDVGWPDGIGELCSAFTTSCGSSASGFATAPGHRYHFTLRAPRGQGWVVPSSYWFCEGAGSDYLSCSVT